MQLCLLHAQCHLPSIHSHVQSVLTLRLCADFQRLVLRNEARAMALVTEADRLEDAQTRTEHAVNRSELRMLAEVEIDVMSDSVRVRGIVSDANEWGGSAVTDGMQTSTSILAGNDARGVCIFAHRCC